MKIVDIFAIVKGSLYSVQFDQNEYDEFALAFRNWADTEYLEDFFEKHKVDLQSGFYGDITVEEAVFKTIDEATDFEAKIKEVSENGNFDEESSLQDLIFYPLHKDDKTFILQESKAYGKENKSWLRIYAIRINPQFYVVSGSAIKLTNAMGEQEHTKTELSKLKITAAYLKEHGLMDDDDFGYIDFAI
jgi:hypothetical protein